MTVADPPSGAEVPHRDETRVIAGLWSDLLGIAEPPMDASFFELGGHSMGIIRLAARLQQAFGLTVPIADLFEHLTIADQVHLVERLFEEQLADLTD